MILSRMVGLRFRGYPGCCYHTSRIAGGKIIQIPKRIEVGTTPHGGWRICRSICETSLAVESLCEDEGSAGQVVVVEYEDEQHGRMHVTRPEIRTRKSQLRLGYACDNIFMKRTKNVYTSRSCIRKTFEDKGLAHVSGLALANCLDLLELIAWNIDNDVHVYRMTSKLFPWAGHYAVEDLPDYTTICDALAAAGELARAADQRITNHPSCYVKLASTTKSITESSIQDLEVQSTIFDLMGYAPSHWNKINIHVGGVYGDKGSTMERFAETFHERLSPSLRARLTVENDDSANSYSVDDLLILHEKTGIPVTFDFHHHQFCPGTMSKKDAFLAAIGTWPKDVRPVVHWSEMPECPQRRKTHPHSHSNFVYGPIDVYGYESEVDVMIESKAKEASLLLYRDMIHVKE